MYELIVVSHDDGASHTHAIRRPSAKVGWRLAYELTVASHELIQHSHSDAVDGEMFSDNVVGITECLNRTHGPYLEQKKVSVIRFVTQESLCLPAGRCTYVSRRRYSRPGTRTSTLCDACV